VATIGERLAVRPARRRPRPGEPAWGYAFLTPQVLGLLAFTLFPIGFSLYLCFAEWDFVERPRWVGLANFRAVFADELFYTSLLNTLFLVAGIVPLTMVASLLLALLTNRALAGLGFYKTAFFLPMVTSSAAIALVWYWLYAPDFGLVNAALGSFGIPGPGWLADPRWSKPAVIISVSWQSVGYYYLIFLAGLKSIPSEYYEASAIDGATRLQQFWRITLPLLSPTTFFVLTTLLIAAFNVFDQIYILTRGGPVDSTRTVVMDIWARAFEYFYMGEAAVASWVLFVVIFGLTLIQFRLSRKWVHHVE
jgi:multiple sugar transport system permease protein